MGHFNGSGTGRMSLAMSTIRDYKGYCPQADISKNPPNYMLIFGNEFGELGQMQTCPQKTPELPTLRCVTTPVPAHV